MFGRNTRLSQTKFSIDSSYNLLGRIDRVYFGTRLEDTTKIGFDDEFQYKDFHLPWEQRKAIKGFPDFEREFALKACEAWQNKKDRHPY